MTKKDDESKKKVFFLLHKILNAKIYFYTLIYIPKTSEHYLSSNLRQRFRLTRKQYEKHYIHFCKLK